MSGTFTASDEFPGDVMMLAYSDLSRDSSNNLQPGIVEIDDLMIVDGSTPAAWAPAEGETLTADGGGGGMTEPTNLVKTQPDETATYTVKAMVNDGGHKDFLKSALENIKLSATTSYHIGITIKPDKDIPSGRVWAWIHYKDDAGATNLRLFANSYAIPAGVWTRLEWAVTVPAGMSIDETALSINRLADETKFQATNFVVYPLTGGRIVRARGATALVSVSDGAKGDQGIPGKDGKSPTVSVSKSGTVTTIVVTNADGSKTTQTVNDGVNGTPGAKGADGKTPYFHVKYSNDGGSTFTSNSGETVGTYIGTYTDYNSADSTSVSSYTWARIKGDTGATGAQGPKGATGPQGPQGVKGDTGISVTSTIDEWYLSTSSTILSGGSWSSTRQAWSSGHYYWRRVKTTYSNNTSKNTPSDNGYYDAAMTAAVSDANSAKSTADDAKKVATNYISTDSSGLMVADLTNKTETPSTATGYNTYISSDGLHVRKGLTDLANFLSSGEQIGLENESHLNLDYHSFKMIDQDGNTYVYISDLRNKDGYYDVTDNFTGDGTTKEFLTSFYVNTSRTVTVTIDGTATTDYSVSNAIHLTFNTAPADGAQIVVNYQTSSKYTKAFTLGMRKEDSSIGTFSYALGSNVDASGYVSYASGYGTAATGNTSYASGYGTTASGRSSYAEGYSTIASGNYSHAQGYASIASGDQAFATGYSNVASGYESYAGGVSCNSIGDVSFTHGRYLYAKATSQVVFGQYNADDANAMLIIGNGSSDSARSNSFTVSTTGLVRSAGGVVTGGDMSASGILAISSNSAYRFMCGGGDSSVWIDCRDSSNTMKNNVILYPTYTALRSTTINGTLNGYNIVGQNKNGPWPKISTVNSDGGIEVGRYIDFHSSSGSTEDYTGRISNFGSEFDFSQAIKAPNFIGNWNGINLAQCARVQAIVWAKTLDCGLKHGIVIISDYRAYLFWYAGTSPNMGISYRAIYGGDANTTFTVLNKTGTGNCWRITVAQNSSITVIGRY